jgi:DNA-binding FrmR family transcriptional regulator
MSEDKDKLVLRIKRIRGQLNAAEKSLLEENEDCSVILHGLTACRGAMGSLISEILEGHVYDHVLTPKSKPDREQLKAAKELTEVIKTYLR